MRLQRVVLLPTTGAHHGLGGPRRAVVLTAPDAASRARADQLGLPVVVCPELAPGGPDDDAGARVHRLDAVVRGHAVRDRWRDLVVVADAESLRDVAAGLCALPGASAVPGDGAVVTVGLPRGSRPVQLAPTLAVAGVVGVLTLLALGRLYPLLPPGAVAGVGLLLLPWTRTRHVGRTLLAAAVLSTVLVLVVVAGSTRFPVE